MSGYAREGSGSGVFSNPNHNAIPNLIIVLAITALKRTLAIGVVSCLLLSFLWAEENMSISATTQSYPQQNFGARLAAKIGLLLVAIVFVTLATAGVEARFGIASSDSAIPWELSGE